MTQRQRAEETPEEMNRICKNGRKTPRRLSKNKGRKAGEETRTRSAFFVMRVKRKNGLTDRQERFCQLRAEGKGQREAYDLAGYSTRQKETARANNANQLEALDYIKARIEELNRLSEAGAVLDLQQIAADLGKIAADENKPDGVRLKAYDQLTRIKGGYTDTTQVALSGSLSLDDKRALFEQMMQE